MHLNYDIERKNMNIIEFKKIEDIQQSIVHFIKIEVTDLGTTLEEILKVLADLSWLNKFILLINTSTDSNISR